MTKSFQQFVVCGAVILLMSGGLAASRCEAGDTPAMIVGETETPQDTGADDVVETPILDQIAKGIDLLHQQIDKQHAELKAATTDRERRLIRDHLSFLRQELHELEQIVPQLADPRFDARAAAQEQQTELQNERDEKILEQRRTTP